MATVIWLSINNWLMQWLFAWRHEAITQQMLTDHQVCSVAPQKNFIRNVHEINPCSEIALLKLPPHLPGANGLMKVMMISKKYIYFGHHWITQLVTQTTGCTECMMTSSNGNVFRVTGSLCREFTDHRWIPRTKASDAELWYFLWYMPE